MTESGVSHVEFRMKATSHSCHQVDVQYIGGRHGVVDVATRYWRKAGVQTPAGRDILYSSGQAPRTTKPPVKWVPAQLAGDKTAGA